MYQQPFLYRPVAAEVKTLNATPLTVAQLKGVLTATAWNSKTVRVMIQNCGSGDLYWIWKTGAAPENPDTTWFQLPSQQILILNMESHDLDALYVAGADDSHPVGIWQEGLK